MASKQQKKGKKSSRKAGQGGGMIGRLIRLLFFLTLVVGVDAFFTQRALTGLWQMEMTPQVEQHLMTLMLQKDAPSQGSDTLGKGLRNWLRQGASVVGAALMKGAAKQVRVQVSGRSFGVVDSAGQAVVTALIALGDQKDAEPIECVQGRMIAAFPLMQVTCVGSEGKEVAQWVLMKSWPGERVDLFPLGLTERRLEELAGQIDARVEGKQAPEARSAETRAALEELFTLHFNRQQGGSGIVGM